MPRCFFKLDGHPRYSDKVGTVLEGPEQARAEAVINADEMLRDNEGEFWGAPGIEGMIRRTVGPAIAVESALVGELWNVMVDAPLLENALLNLAINARDAMPEGGKLTIETGNRWLDERSAKTRDLPPGQYVSLCVSDDGTGMTAEVIAKAFDPFFTTKPIGVGTGLGLSMVYGFARQSGGQVRIHSEVGQGTTVCLYLPRHLGEAEGDEAMAAAA